MKYMLNMIFMYVYIMSFYLVLNVDDWFMVWIGLELNMMMFIVMIYQINSFNNIESCMSYFFIQSIGSAVFVGCIFYYEVMLDFYCLMVLSMKMGAAPLYFWFPSVCKGISWWGCFLLMVFQSILPLMLVIMFLEWFVFIIVMMSLIVGVYGSFNQVNMKLLLAYSSIHHIGWLMLCMIYGGKMWLYYLMMYGLMMLSVIYVFWIYNVNSLEESLKYDSKWWIVLMMLSMGGMPPMLGFFLKWFGFMMIINMNLYMLMYMVFFSVMMFYVYMRCVYGVLLGMSDGFVWIIEISKWFYCDLIMVMGVMVGSLVILLIIFW